MSGATKQEGWQESGLEMEVDFKKFEKLKLEHDDGYKEQPALFLYTAQGQYSGALEFYI